MRDESAPCDEDEVLRSISEQPSSSAQPTLDGDTLYRLPSIYFIGDSRAMPFRNGIYTSEFTSRVYQLRSVHLPSLHAADFYSGKRGLNAPLVGTLATDQTIISSDEGLNWAVTDDSALVLFCGAYDQLGLMDELGPDAVIAESEEDSVRLRVFELMRPFAQGIDALRAYGFDRIFVHGSPPHESGARFAERFGAFKAFRQVDIKTRGKVREMFDEAARSIARSTGSHYLPGPVDERGKIATEVTYDDVHYNDLGVRMTARTVVSVIEGVIE